MANSAKVVANVPNNVIAIQPNDVYGQQQRKSFLEMSNGKSYGSFDPSVLAEQIINGLNLNDPSNYLQSALDIAELNTMNSQALAREQMKFQTEANAKAMDFNSLEAQKVRDWEQMMSNTAHQREVEDLIAAGLNPILSANQGATTPNVANATGVTSSGAKGTVDTSAVQALTQAYVQAKQLEMQAYSLQMEDKKIDAQIAMNLLNNETNKYAADRAAQANMYSAGLNSSAHRYAAELDYSTWTSGLHNQYAQLGEWIYKALTGMDFKNMFNFNITNDMKNWIKEMDIPKDSKNGGGAW